MDYPSLDVNQLVAKRPSVLGIAGGSGSGKSTVINHIVQAVGAQFFTILDHDAYYRDLTHLTFEERVAFNFDHPDALETNLMRRHLDLLLKGVAVNKPEYDFCTHTRKQSTIRCSPRPFIVIEGILVLAEPVLEETMDIKIYVDTDDDVRLLRRIKRDLEERGRDILSILDQYERTVRPMFIEYVEPSKRKADIIIPRGGHNRVAVEVIIARLKQLLISASTTS